MATINLQVNLDYPLGVLQTKLQGLVDMIAIGVAGCEKIADVKTPLPGVWIEHNLGRPPFANIENARSAFTDWILGIGFREGIEAFHLFLDDVYEACYAMNSTKGFSGDLEAWKASVSEAKSAFNHRKFPQKISELKGGFGLSVDAFHEESMLSINKTRNCYVHRGGIVGDDDINKTNGLRVSWSKIETIVMKEGTFIRVITGPSVVQGGESIGVRTRPETKTFSKGVRVVFTAQEFSEILWFLTTIGTSIRGEVVKYAQKMGIPLKAVEMA
jgi:hypothetical protein